MSPLAATKAEAALLFCNKTKTPLEAAVGYNEQGTWVSEGWWEIAPRLCKRVYDKKFPSKMYYYARSFNYGGKGGAPVVWSGDAPFCFADKAFWAEGREDCQSRNYIVGKFHEIDAEPDQRDYTLNFCSTADCKK